MGNPDATRMGQPDATRIEQPDATRIEQPVTTKKDFTYHSSRHSTATLAITAGADISAVKEMLGHISLGYIDELAA